MEVFSTWWDQVSDRILSDLQWSIHLKGVLSSQIYIAYSTPSATLSGMSRKQGSCIILVALRSWSTEPQRSWVPIQGCGSPHKGISVTEKAGATALAGISLDLYQSIQVSFNRDSSCPIQTLASARGENATSQISRIKEKHDSFGLSLVPCVSTGLSPLSSSQIRLRLLGKGPVLGTKKKLK